MTVEIQQLLTDAANRYGVSPELAIAQAQAESGGQQFKADGSLVVSPAGAIGVMQLMPATAAGLGVDPTDTAQNIDGGVRYLSQLLRQFSGNVQLALAAYNWGPGHVSKNGFENWPTETVNYVNKILANVGSAITSLVTGNQAPDGTDPNAGGGGSAPPSNDILLALVLGGAIFFYLLWGVRA